jgi:flagellar motor switch protein FliN/FliY
MSVNELAAQAEVTRGGPPVGVSSTPPPSAAGPQGTPAASSPAPAIAGQPAASSPAPAIRPFELDELPPVAVVQTSQNIELLMGVSLQVTVEIGRTKLAIRDVLALTPGSIVELDKLAGEKVDVLVNGQQIAQGEVVVVDENFGVRITDVVSRQRRILSADTAA